MFFFRVLFSFFPQLLIIDYQLFHLTTFNYYLRLNKSSGCGDGVPAPQRLPGWPTAGGTRTETHAEKRYLTLIFFRLFFFHSLWLYFFSRVSLLLLLITIIINISINSLLFLIDSYSQIFVEKVLKASPKIPLLITFISVQES
ncbi:unnamed protein product [Caenorhabditis auriculariae]|uniref:Uncharacterized protein n=1 Tax=Caenorhabditis auriculariae TaxID=2777116 RepID=A0A8S1GRS8_9PELO|nr:unnamed protein product [Caenorhabditis auriculariae]